MENTIQPGTENEYVPEKKIKKKRAVRPRVKVLVKASGGARAGAGRPPGEPQKNVLFQIPVRLDELFKIEIRKLKIELLSGSADLTMSIHQERKIIADFRERRGNKKIPENEEIKKVVFKIPLHLEKIFKLKARELMLKIRAENPLSE